MTFSFAPAVANSDVFSLPQRPDEQRLYKRVQINQIYPAQAYLLGELNPDLFITQPLQIIIERDEDATYVVSDEVFLVYGNGKNRSEAIGDYVSSLVKYYELVEKNAAINSFDNQLLTHLQTYIQSRQLRGFNAIQTNRD